MQIETPKSLALCIFVLLRVSLHNDRTCSVFVVILQDFACRMKLELRIKSRKPKDLKKGRKPRKNSTIDCPGTIDCKRTSSYNRLSRIIDCNVPAKG